MGSNPLSKQQIADSAIVEEAELLSRGFDGTPFQSGVVVDSTTASTKTIQFNSAEDIEEPRVQSGDLVEILSGAAAGKYTVDTVDIDNVKVIVVETIADSTSTTANIYYAPGAKITGIDARKSENIMLGSNLQAFLNRVYAPDISQKPTYTGDDIDYIEYFKGPTQTTPNRLAKATLSYSGDDPSSEEWEFYDEADGTTVLKTATLDYTWAGDNLSKVEMETT